MSDAIWAARLGDGLEHTSMMADIVGGVLEVAANVAIGALATAAVVAATGITVATGGIGACVLGAVVGLVVGVAMAKTGADTGLSRLCESIGNGLFPPSIQATIATGSRNTKTNNKPSARAAGWVPPGMQVVEESGEEPESSYLDMAKNFFSQMWRPTVASPAPGAQPLPEDLVTCTKHPPMPPQYLAEGSAKVTINGQPAVRSGDRSTCEAVVVSAGPISSDVRIGGEKLVVREIRSGKTPGVGLAVSVLMMLKGGKGKFLSNLPCMMLGMVNSYVVSSATNAVIRATSASPNPVHAATGAKVLGGDEELDFVLPGILPIAWQRFYNSRDERCDGLFGAGWSVAYEVCVEVLPHPDGGERLVYTDEQGRRIDMGSIPLGGAVFSAGEGLSVRRHACGQLLIESDDGLYRLFEPSPLDASLLRLSLLGDRNDNRIFVDYDAEGRLAGLHDTFDDVRLLLSYSAQWPRRLSHIERIYPDAQREVLARYTCDALGQLAEVRNALDQVQRRFAYDGERRMTEHRLPTGLRCFYEWALIDDREWRVVRHWTDEGDAYAFDYDLAAGTTTVRDGLNRISQRCWDRQQQITAYTDTLGHTWRFEWNDERQLLAATDPLGGEYRHTYDESGNITTMTDPLGRCESVLWLEHWALPLVETDAAGHSWHYRYDRRGNCIRETDPLGHVTRYRYDDQGNLVEIIDAAGKTKTRQHDALGQLTRYTDCSGYPTVFAYDRRGHLHRVTDALGEHEVYTHDAQGHLLECRLADGRIEQYQRDACGQLTGYIDPAGYRTLYAYDPRGKVRQRTDAHGRQVGYHYDAYQRLQAMVNENGEAYRFAWDAADRLTEQTGLDGLRHCYTYDALDQAIGKVSRPADHPDIIEHVLERDAASRVIAKTTADGITHYRYDAVNQLLGATFISPEGQPHAIGFTYDANRQVIAEQGMTGRLEHRYDELGNLTRTRLPDGRWINRLYYGSGHLHQINVDGVVVMDFERDRLHREVLRTQGQWITCRDYDRCGRPRSRTRRPATSPPQLPAAIQQHFEFDASDNLAASVLRQPEGSRQQILQHDATSRILSNQIVQQGNVGQGHYEVFAYDPAANLLDPRQGAAARVRHDQVLAFQDKRYRYDAFGRVVEKRSATRGLQGFSYDDEGRLAEIRQQRSDGQVITRLQYDPLGRRIGKTESNAQGYVLGTSVFVWDGPQLIQELRNGQSSLYLYEDQQDQALARIDGLADRQQIRYYHNDLSGIALQLTGPDGQLLWQAEYCTWGNTLEEQRQVNGIQEQNLRFQGQYLDRETGLHYNTFRFYDPDIGRYLTPDPVGLRGGLNLYTYAPNPFTFIDPWGWTGTYIFTDGTTSYIGKGPRTRANQSMNARIGGSANATQFAHQDFGDSKLGFMVEHRLMEKYNARNSSAFANSPNMNSPGKKLYAAADLKTQRKVNRLANNLNKKFKASKGCG